MSHTPGPWELQPSRQHPNNVWEVVGPSEVVAGLDGICQPHRMNDRTFAEDAANMRLISAAPDLLEALKDCINVMTMQNYRANENLIEMCKCVVSKAQGKRDE